MKKSLGIIGFGRFAQFFTPYLKPYFSDITVTSKTNKDQLAKNMGVKFSSLKETAKKDIIILAMPISKTENILNKIKIKVKPQAIVMDVCSVKVYTAKLMKKILPRNVYLLGTHPLFGPQSGKNGITGLEIVLCPERLPQNELENIKSFFLGMGLNAIISTAKEHDIIMANTQALTHFFAKGVLKSLPKTDFKFSTPSARKLFSIVNDIKNDSPALFNDIETFNPYAKSARTKLLKNLQRIDKQLR